MVAELQPELADIEPSRALTQIANHTIESAGGPLTIVVEQQQPNIKAYNILAPGFLGIHSAYARLRHETAQLDANTGAISIHPPRNANLRHPDKVMSQGIWHVIKYVAAQTGASRFDLTAHSMAGVGTVNAVKHIVRHKDPGLLGSVTLNASAGVTNHNLLTLPPRAAGLLLHEIHDNWQQLSEQVGPTMTQEIWRYIRHRQTLYEIASVCGANILKDVAMLSEIVPIYALYFPKDLLFDAERAERNLRSRVHNFKVLESPAHAGHLGGQLFPAEVAAANAQLRAAA